MKDYEDKHLVCSNELVMLSVTLNYIRAAFIIIIIII